MSEMFTSNSFLSSLDLSNFNTKNVKSMNHMFAGCQGLSELNLKSFDTSNLEDMGYMFYNDRFTSLN